MPNNDPQAKPLYKMEDSFMMGSLRARAPLDELQAIADKVCRRWGVPPVTVRFAKHRKWYGMYYGDQDLIELFAHKNRVAGRLGSGRNVPVLLHELAHHIDDHKIDCSRSAESHGPNFAAVCVDLYDHYEVLPADAYKLLAKRFGVKIARGVHHKMKKRRRARRG